MEHGAHPVTQIVGFDPPLDDHCVGALSKSFTRYYYPSMKFCLNFLKGLAKNPYQNGEVAGKI